MIRKIAFLLMLLGLPALAQDYAIFTELSPDSKPMKAGWNTRVFTDTQVKKGEGIQCDFATGLITLAPGTYHITGSSLVTYNSGAEPPEMATMRIPASAGYSRLRVYVPGLTTSPGSLRGIENSDPSVICLGTPSTANMGNSLVETYYTTDKPAQILFEHQSGSNPDHIFLRVFTENSKWHLFARICIRRM